MNDAISIEVQWDKEGGRCLDLSRSLAPIHFQTMGERCEGEEPSLSHEKVTGWATQQEGFGYDIDTESMTIGCPASTKGRGVARESGRVAPGTGNGHGKGSFGKSRDVARRVLCNPVRTVVRSSASAAM